MKSLKVIFSLLLVFVVMLSINIQSLLAQTKKWEVPKEYVEKVNPVALNDKALNAGKDSYLKLCVFCHGKTGVIEDFMSAMNPKPTDLTTEEFHAQSDGELFYKIRTGKPPKPSFEHHLTEEQTWELVHYLRSLKAKTAISADDK